MTEFQELTQDAPNFVSMERGELVAYAYGMFAAGTKADAENAKLRDGLENARMRGDDLASSIREWRAVTEARGQTIDRLAAENAKLRELVEDMHAALQAFCDAQDVHGDNCPLWVERTDDCELRGIERRMRELGVDE